MKALVLAAGYGTRLERDLKADKSGKYADLIGMPKPLLPIGGVPLISRWMDILAKFPAIDRVIVVVNDLNKQLFEQWAKSFDNVDLVSEGSVSNDTRSGAVAAINIGVQHFNINEPLLVIGGDTLFYEDFDLVKVISGFEAVKKEPEANMLLCYPVNDEGTRKHGILEVDDASKVTAFLEKPGPEATSSRLSCPCFYLFSSEALPLLSQFLEEKKDVPLAERDAPGNFIRYIIDKLPCYAQRISGRFDVGGLQSYIECDDFFAQKKDTST